LVPCVASLLPLHRSGLLAAALLLGVQPACTSTRYVIGLESQAYYQTAWPLHDTSRQIEEIFLSVKRIHVTGYYETFLFAPEDRVTRGALRNPETYRRARDRFVFDHAKAGTAIAISRVDRAVHLMTNAHVTRMQDTITAYFDSAAHNGRFIESVAILRSKTNVIVGVPTASQFRVAASDTLADLALLRVEVEHDVPEQAVPPLRAPAGDPGRLSWGSFVYVLGYPRGYMMVTRAIVSNPRQSPDNTFLLDGLFNRGISGGLVLAVRGETGALEWVGLATSASANTEVVLAPERRGIDEQGVLLPYQGRLFIEEVRRIDYGITFSVPATAVTRFLRNSRMPVPGASS
jgi:hypothetical protein